MKVEIELSREQIEETLQGVLGSCFTTWSWWKVCKYDEGYGWNKYPADLEEKFLTMGILDPDHYDDIPEDDDDDNEAEPIVKKLSAKDILQAWSVCSIQGVRVSDEDAISGDAIIQTAVLGEITYG